MALEYMSLMNSLLTLRMLNLSVELLQVGFTKGGWNLFSTIIWRSWIPGIRMASDFLLLAMAMESGALNLAQPTTFMIQWCGLPYKCTQEGGVHYMHILTTLECGI